MNRVQRLCEDIEKIKHEIKNLTPKLEYNDLEKLKSIMCNHKVDIEGVIEEIVLEKHKKFLETATTMYLEYQELVLETNFGLRLRYNFYLTKDEKKELVLERVPAYAVIEINVSNRCDYIINKLNNSPLNLTSDEIDFIIAKLIRLKGSVILRKEELMMEERNKESSNSINLSNSSKLGEHKDTLKKIYRLLCKEFHPDLGGSTEEMTVVNLLKETWKV